jgi:hypothetical protein
VHTCIRFIHISYSSGNKNYPRTKLVDFTAGALLNRHLRLCRLLHDYATMRTNTRENPSTKSVTFLRVKRARDLPPLSSTLSFSMKLRRGPPKQNDDDIMTTRFSRLLATNPTVVAPGEEQQFHQQATTKSIVANRIAEDSNFRVLSGNSASGSSVNDNKKVRVLEVLYENNVLLGGGEEGEESLPKRRKVQLHVLESKEISYKDLFCSSSLGSHEKAPRGHPVPSGNQKKNNSLSTSLVLDPLTRIIDEQLKLAFELRIDTGCIMSAGSNNGGNYLLQLFQNDYLSSTIPSPMQRLNKILYHSISSSTFKGGTIVHTISLWNNVNLFHDLVQQLKDIIILIDAETVVHPDISCKTNDIISALLATTNEDEMTPIQLAQILGNHLIVSEFERFKGEHQHQYVYDMFCVEDVESITSSGDSSRDACDSSVPGSVTNDLKPDIGENVDRADSGNLNVIDEEDAVSVEFKGGLLGYWNEQGELILVHDEEDEKGEALYENDYDHDSNDEFYEGNDYPEEEEEEESRSISSEVSSSNESRMDNINHYATTRQQIAYCTPFSLRDRGSRNDQCSNASSSFGEESSSSCEEEYEDRFSRRYFNTRADRKKLQFVEPSMLLKNKHAAYAYDSEYEDHE